MLEFGDESERIMFLEKINKTEGADLQNFIQTLKRQEINSALLPFFKSVYFMAKNDLPIALCSRIYDLYFSLGLEVSPHYRDRNDSLEIISYISDKIRSDIAKELINCKAIGVMIDESTDIRNRKILTINIKYFSGGKLQNKLLSIYELDAGDAKTIYNSLRVILDRFNIFNKVSSFCTDGASAMLSDKNGVTGLMKRHLKPLHSSH